MLASNLLELLQEITTDLKHLGQIYMKFHFGMKLKYFANATSSSHIRNELKKDLTDRSETHSG